MPDLAEKVNKILDEKIRPSLEMHGGGVDVVKINEKEGIVTLSFRGECIGCPSADMTFDGLIGQELKTSIPEIKSIELE
jgi:Fe-S cluster biogenesis protein NfuA